MYRQVLYYIDIYIYIVSVCSGGVSSCGCQLDVNLLFFRGLYSETLREKEKNLMMVI